MLDWDKDEVYRMAALQSKAGRELLQCCGREPTDISSIVLVSPGGCAIKRWAPLHATGVCVAHTGPSVGSSVLWCARAESQGLCVCSEAILGIASRLAIPLRLLGALAMPLPHALRDAVYDTIANNRYSIFGKSNTCRYVTAFADTVWYLQHCSLKTAVRTLCCCFLHVSNCLITTLLWTLARRLSD